MPIPGDLSRSAGCTGSDTLRSDHAERFHGFVNGVPPERFLVVMGMSSLRCVLALMPRNSLDVTIVTSSGASTPQVSFKLHQSRALLVSEFNFDNAADRTTMTAIYLNLIGRGITGRLATIVSQGEFGRVWSMTDGSRQLENMLMDCSLAVDRRAAVAPVNSITHPNAVAGTNGTIVRQISQAHIADGDLVVMNENGTVMLAPANVDRGQIIGRCIRSEPHDFDTFAVYVQICDADVTPATPPSQVIGLQVGEFSVREEVEIHNESDNTGRGYSMHGGKVRLEIIHDSARHSRQVAVTLVHSSGTDASLAREITRRRELEMINARLTAQVVAANEMLRSCNMSGIIHDRPDEPCD